MDYLAAAEFDEELCERMRTGEELWPNEACTTFPDVPLPF